MGDSLCGFKSHPRHQAAGEWKARDPGGTTTRRRSQVVKAEVCKTSIRRFESARRLQHPSEASTVQVGGRGYGSKPHCFVLPGLVLTWPHYGAPDSGSGSGGSSPPVAANSSFLGVSIVAVRVGILVRCSRRAVRMRICDGRRRHREDANNRRGQARNGQSRAVRGP